MKERITTTIGTLVAGLLLLTACASAEAAEATVTFNGDGSLGCPP